MSDRLVVRAALRLACTRLAEHYLPVKSAYVVQEQLISFVEDALSNGPMPLCSVEQMTLRFACEELVDDPSQAPKLEDEFMRQAREYVKGMEPRYAEDRREAR